MYGKVADPDRITKIISILDGETPIRLDSFSEMIVRELLSNLHYATETIKIQDDAMERMSKALIRAQMPDLKSVPATSPMLTGHSERAKASFLKHAFTRYEKKCADEIAEAEKTAQRAEDERRAKLYNSLMGIPGITGLSIQGGPDGPLDIQFRGTPDVSPEVMEEWVKDAIEDAGYGESEVIQIDGPHSAGANRLFDIIRQACGCVPTSPEELIGKFFCTMPSRRG